MKPSAVKVLSSWFHRLLQSPFSPWQGEKVADRPDEGGFAASNAIKTLTALREPLNPYSSDRSTLQTAYEDRFLQDALRACKVPDPFFSKLL